MHRNRLWIVLLAAAVAACCLGCRQESDQGKNGKPPKKPGAAAPEKTADPSGPAAVEPPPKPAMPTVKLSEALAATCLVKVDQAMPEATLPDLAGKPTKLQSLLGPKLTVLCFWKAENAYAVEELRDLQKDVAGPYEAKGVRVVGINESDSAEVAGQKVKEVGATFANLLDADGAFFQKVATEKLPRTYLLDAQGKVLWFDIEYSRDTRRDLLLAIELTLEKK